MTEYYVQFEDGTIKEEGELRWNRIIQRIVKIGLKRNGVIVREYSLPLTCKGVFQCKFANMYQGSVVPVIHIVGYIDQYDVKHAYAINFRDGTVDRDFPTDGLDLSSHTIWF